MKKLLASDKIYISKSKMSKAGRGVFAKVNIKKGEIIETCPVIEVPEEDVANLNGSFLVTYFFYFGKKKNQLLLALGCGSLYNHTYAPNSTYKIKQKNMEIEFVALREIKKDEEITFNYSNGNPNNKKPLWFEVAGF